MKHTYSMLLRRWAHHTAGVLGLLLATAGAAQAQTPATFAPAVTYGTGSVPQGIVLVDVNGDGRLDIITANSGSNNVGVLLGSATTPGTFPATATFYGSGGSFPVGLGVGDVNGDGRPDIVVSNQGSNTVGVLLNQAAAPGTFGAATGYGSGNSTPRGLALTDVNQDGRLDIVTGGNGNLGVLLNLAAAPGTFGTAAAYSTGTQADAIAVGDVNGDGRPDVAVSNLNGSTISLLLNSASAPGTFPAVASYNTGGTNVRGITLGDVNGDGRLDLVTGNQDSNNISVLLNQAAAPGTFGAAALYSSGANGPNGVVVLDMNGDGRPDIVSANYDGSGGSTVSVLLNSATTLGTFLTGTPYNSGGTGPIRIAVGDVSGDGKPDITTTLIGNAAVGVLLNTTVYAAPTLTSLNPNTGPVGTQVIITGTNLTGTTAVSFNGTAASSFVVNSATSITAVVAAGTTSGPVTVTTPGGTSNGLPFTITYPDLVVSTTTPIAAGTYNSITVTSTGNGTLAGNVTVISSTSVQSGGTLNDGCYVISGTGSFTLAAGATLGICSAAGITSSGATGAVQSTGPRSFSNDATYVYNGTAAQSTGNGLPGRVRNLTTTNANNVALSASTSVAQVLTVGAAGNLATGGNTLTLLSSSAGTALVVNSSTGVVSGAATVQRAIDPSVNPGPGYRHYSAPVSNSTVADLTTPGFTPTVNPAYNTSATPNFVQPFPTVFGYDDSRLSMANNLPAFDKGYFSPAALDDQLAVGRGYSVNISASELVDFQGTLNNGTLTLPLTSSRNTYPDGGWQLLGNPYPAPLDYSRVAVADRLGLESAIYVYSSTSQYQGRYRTYLNGIGNPVLPVGQGFFARVAVGQPAASLTFRNSYRLTVPDGTTFQRTAADPRPLVQLALSGLGLSDDFYAYAEAGATAATEADFDAVKLPNPSGLNLASLAGSQALAIDGRAAFSLSTTIPLSVGVPAAGTYTLRTAALNNLPTGLEAYLRDSQTGQTVRLTAGTSYAFSVAASQAATHLLGRFTLQFSPDAALAAAPTLSTAEVAVYPNPAHERFAVQVPAVVGASSVQAELLNTLGQVVRRQTAALPGAGTTLTIETTNLAQGVYTLRLQAGSSTLAKQVMVQ